MTLARTLMVQGTASSVGKSLLVAALCRHFARAGLRVAPFKSQNMSNNSAVTPEGYEIGRAQAVQAQASMLPPRVEMNPILLKPEADQRAQVVVFGKPIGSMQAREYHDRKVELRQVVADSLRTLRQEHDLVVIEGAGSPAEVNLKERDLVNMFVAELAGAPVLLVGDIDRGGVFASLVGTLELLEPAERDRIAGLVINKFRGDLSLLDSGLSFLEQRTQKTVLGVVPHIPGLRIADEDSVALDDRGALDDRAHGTHGEHLDIAVIRLPHISNYDDVLPLEREPAVNVRFVDRAGALGFPDLLILPGSKATVADLMWLRESGLAAEVVARAERGGRVLGICGGCQMLGQRLEDPDHIESSVSSVAGLDLLPIRTRYRSIKTTADVRAVVARPSFLTKGLPANTRLSAYEIHMGEVESTAVDRAAFTVVSRNGVATTLADGAVDGQGAVVGTMLHGIFENPSVRASLLSSLGSTKSNPGSRPGSPVSTMDAEFDRLEMAVSSSLDMKTLWRLTGLEERKPPV